MNPSQRPARVTVTQRPVSPTVGPGLGAHNWQPIRVPSGKYKTDLPCDSGARSPGRARQPGTRRRRGRPWRPHPAEVRAGAETGPAKRNCDPAVTVTVAPATGPGSPELGGHGTCSRARPARTRAHRAVARSLFRVGTRPASPVHARPLIMAREPPAHASQHRHEPAGPAQPAPHGRQGAPAPRSESESL